MRRVAVLVALMGILLFACKPDPGPGPPPSGGGGGSSPPSSHGDVRFQSTCSFSHALPDDPIVFPGVAGASHLHHFFGNVTTNASSTFATLRAAPGTTCQPTADLAGYWVPALLLNGTAIPPQFATFYYRGPKLAYTSVQAFPPDFRMIAGDSHATAPQGSNVTYWGCTDGSSTPSATVPACPAGTQLKLVVNFPNCWDGVNLDSANHKSHVAYASYQGTCPATHPVLLPAIQAFIRYPTTGGAGAALSSGSDLTAHADFLNAWDQTVLVSRVQTCINAGIACKTDGTPG